MDLLDRRRMRQVHLAGQVPHNPDPGNRLVQRPLRAQGNIEVLAFPLDF